MLHLALEALLYTLHKTRKLYTIVTTTCGNSTWRHGSGRRYPHKVSFPQRVRVMEPLSAATRSTYSEVSTTTPMRSEIGTHIPSEASRTLRAIELG